MNVRKILVPLLWMTGFAVAQQAREIDTQHSTLTVRVYKTGLFSFAADDHAINAPISSGGAITDSSVRVSVETQRMKVLDPKLEPDKRAEVQKKMRSDAVLDVAKFPVIEFVSTQVTPKGSNHWTVSGNLTLHGQTHPVTMDVGLNNGHYIGASKFKQTDFGIKPVTIAGGTVKVKDEVKIEFDVVAK